MYSNPELKLEPLLPQIDSKYNPTYVADHEALKLQASLTLIL